MAFRQRVIRNDDEAASRHEPPPVRPASEGWAPASFLDASASFTGKLSCRESLRIDGRVKGEVRCDHKVAIGETGKVRAAIEADTVVIAGEVAGDIIARRKITLEKTARVKGDLSTPGIVIQEGAKLEGRITIGSETTARPQPADRTAESKKPAVSATGRSVAVTSPGAAPAGR